MKMAKFMTLQHEAIFPFVLSTRSVAGACDVTDTLLKQLIKVSTGISKGRKWKESRRKLYTNVSRNLVRAF